MKRDQLPIKQLKDSLDIILEESYFRSEEIKKKETTYFNSLKRKEHINTYFMKRTAQEAFCEHTESNKRARTLDASEVAHIDYFSILPNEILALIFSFVKNNFNDENNISRIQLRLVCQQWFSWLTVNRFKLRKISSEEMESLVQCFGGYDKPIGLRFHYAASPQDDQLTKLRSLPQLTALNISIQAKFNVSSLTQLKKLITYRIDADTLATLSHLTRLDVRHIDNARGTLDLPSVKMSFRTLSNVTHVTKPFTQLTRLKVGSEHFDVQFFNNTPNIKVLKCGALRSSNQNVVTLPALQKLVTQGSTVYFSLPNNTLKKLEAKVLNPTILANQSNLITVAVRKVPRAWINQPEIHLTSLHHFSLGRITDGLLQMVATNAQQLKSLQIGIDPRNDKDTLDCLSKLKNLDLVFLHPHKMANLNIAVLSSISKLTALAILTKQTLILSEDLSKLVGLQRLYLNGDIQPFTNFQYLTNFTQLKKLHVPDKASFVPGLDSLQSLTISATTQIDLVGFPNLTRLAIVDEITKDEVWNDIATLTRLRILELRDFKSPELILPRLTTLQYLTQLGTAQKNYAGELRQMVLCYNALQK